jgi:hypothetical protein
MGPQTICTFAVVEKRGDARAGSRNNSQDRRAFDGFPVTVKEMRGRHRQRQSTGYHIIVFQKN